MQQKKNNRIEIIILSALCLLFLANALVFIFQDSRYSNWISLHKYTQDDAFISYRYVENFVEGHGLVYNYGERVEGYTNFLWIMILSLTTFIGLPIIITSKILGLAFSIGTIILSYLLSKKFLGKQYNILAFLPPLLLALNSAFTLWTISGLESAMFIFLATLVIYIELGNNKYTPYILVLATLTRPEGGLLFGIIFLYRLILKKAGFRSLLIYCVTYIGILIPYGIFKLIYFGDLLPNPFYAKTGLSQEYFLSGLEYFWKFAVNHGIFGLIFILPLFFLKRLNQPVKLFWMTVIIYTIYIILIGGDVLKIHRFFLPILPLLFILLTFFLHNFIRTKLPRKFTITAVVVLLCGYIFWTILIPRPQLDYTIRQEKALLAKMTRMTSGVKRIDNSNFSFATSTIGKAGYELMGHRVIDMLGLTDPYIAKNPEKIEGMNTTWKERNFNSTYLLEQRPDYMLFSTSYKPSAPAERALFLNSHFRQNYTTICFPLGTIFDPVWKKVGDFRSPNIKMKNPEYAQVFYDAYNLYNQNKFRKAIEKMKQVIALGENDFALPEHFMATLYIKTQEYDKMLEHINRAIKIYPDCMEAHFLLYLYYSAFKDYEKMNIVYDRLRVIAPWFRPNWLKRADIPSEPPPPQNE